jgi:hypothetical protein
MEEGNRDRIQICHKFYQIIKGILCSTVWILHSYVLRENYASASMLSRNQLVESEDQIFGHSVCVHVHAGMLFCVVCVC